MNYILFDKAVTICHLRTICETECPIFLNSYLHAYGSIFLNLEGYDIP